MTQVIECLLVAAEQPVAIKPLEMLTKEHAFRVCAMPSWEEKSVAYTTEMVGNEIRGVATKEISVWRRLGLVSELPPKDHLVLTLFLLQGVPNPLYIIATGQPAILAAGGDLDLIQQIGPWVSFTWSPCGRNKTCGLERNAFERFAVNASIPWSSPLENRTVGVGDSVDRSGQYRMRIISVHSNRAFVEYLESSWNEISGCHLFTAARAQ
jgi:hypothetical protein